jgi:hypothetical protein
MFDWHVLEVLEQRRLLSSAVFISDQTDDFGLLPVIDDQEWVIAQDSIRMNWDDSKAVLTSDSTTISGVLANFTNVGGNDRFAAVIDWGDEVTTEGTIERMSDGTFSVVGSHDYGVKGDFYISVEITADDGSYGYDFHQALTQADQLTLTIAPQLYSYKSDTAEETYVASFFDRDALDESAYTVTIDWGDGTSSPGRVVRAWDGSFDVVGDHAYSTAGDYTMSFTVSRPQDGTQAATLSASGNSQVWDDSDYWSDEGLYEDVLADDIAYERMSDECSDDDQLTVDDSDVVDDSDAIDDSDIAMDDSDGVELIALDVDRPVWQWINVDMARGPVVYAAGVTAGELQLGSATDATVGQQSTSQVLSPPVQGQSERAAVSTISSDVFQADKKITFGDDGEAPVV